MDSSLKNTHDSGKEQTEGAKLVSEKTEGVTVEPGEIKDKSDGMEEQDYKAKNSIRHREDD